MKDVLTIPELMEYLSLSRTTVYYLMKRGEIKYAKIGSRVIFRLADVDKFIAARIVKPKKPKS